MQTLWIVGAFLLGYGLCAVTAIGGPMTLASARRRGFWVGWEAREKYPPDARQRTFADVTRLLAEDNCPNHASRAPVKTADKDHFVN